MAGVQESHQAFYRAVAAGGADLDELLADTFVYRTAAGTTLGKAALIALLGSGTTRVSSPVLAPGSTALGDDTAVSAGEVELGVPAGDAIARIRARYLHVWIRVSGRWRLGYQESDVIR
jgi:hypothetical protein